MHRSSRTHAGQVPRRTIFGLAHSRLRRGPHFGWASDGVEAASTSPIHAKRYGVRRPGAALSGQKLTRKRRQVAALHILPTVNGTYTLTPSLSPATAAFVICLCSRPAFSASVSVSTAPRPPRQPRPPFSPSILSSLPMSLGNGPGGPFYGSRMQQHGALRHVSQAGHQGTSIR